MTYTLADAKADYEALGKRIAELEKKQKPYNIEDAIRLGEEVPITINFAPIVKSILTPRRAWVKYDGNEVTIRLDNTQSGIFTALDIAFTLGGSSD